MYSLIVLTLVLSARTLGTYNDGFQKAKPLIPTNASLLTPNTPDPLSAVNICVQEVEPQSPSAPN